jgi:hypothetical protein
MDKEREATQSKYTLLSKGEQLRSPIIIKGGICTGMFVLAIPMAIIRYFPNIWIVTALYWITTNSGEILR